jgi:hypothetical protein
MCPIEPSQLTAWTEPIRSIGIRPWQRKTCGAVVDRLTPGYLVKLRGQPGWSLCLPLVVFFLMSR